MSLMASTAILVIGILLSSQLSIVWRPGLTNLDLIYLKLLRMDIDRKWSGGIKTS